MVYTGQDAINKVISARIGSLAPDKINLDYLNSLRLHVQRWLDSIDDTILDTNIKNQGKEL